MADLESVVTDVQAVLGDEGSLSDGSVETLAKLRYADLYALLRWSRSLRDFTISTVAQTSSTEDEDTVTVTNGSATVTVDSDLSGTPFTSGMVGRQMLIGGASNYVFIKTFNSTSSIDIGDGEGNDVAWPGDTATDNAWRMFKTLYTLPSNADEVVSLAGQEGWIEELDGGRERLDTLDWQRETTNNEPSHWVYAGMDSSHVREIELWPVPSEARILRGQYTRTAPTLSGSSTIDIHYPLLVYGTIVDAARHIMAKHGASEAEMWHQTALTYERKMNEILDVIRLREQDKLSLPTSIHRGRRGLGSDFYIDHQHPSEFPPLR